MFQLDDKFLADIGLNDLPDEQKQAFLQHIYEELELRVGTRLSDGLSDQQLEEFEKIIDRDQAVDGDGHANYDGYVLSRGIEDDDSPVSELETYQFDADTMERYAREW